MLHDVSDDGHYTLHTANSLPSSFRHTLPHSIIAEAQKDYQLTTHPVYCVISIPSSRQATEQLLKDNFGFFAGFFRRAVENMATAVDGSDENLRVGRRKRVHRWNQRDAAAGGGGEYFLVPPERALVPVTVCAAKED